MTAQEPSEIKHRKFAQNGFIDKVGIELEGGGWRKGRSTPGWKHDGSVRSSLGHGSSGCDCDPDDDCGCDSYDGEGQNDAGEVVSKPFQTWHWTRRWLLREWPQNVDRTCGLHVHTSFVQPEHYTALMHPEFWKFFQKRIGMFIKRNHGAQKNGRTYALFQLKSRFVGDNSYCQSKFTARNQFVSGGDRYTQLNYCYYKYNTLECRLLPMFSERAGGVRMAAKAIRYLLNTYEIYLRRFDFEKLSFEGDDGLAYEEPDELLVGQQVDRFAPGQLKLRSVQGTVEMRPAYTRRHEERVVLQLGGAACALQP